MTKRITPILVVAFAAAAAVLLRLAAVAFVQAGPTLGVQIPDPDGYARAGALLVAGGHHWTFAAVDYFGFIKAPLYPAFLSLFARVPDYPRTVPLAQAALGALSVLSVYVLGRALHSTRAALIAAGATAVWFPFLIAPSGLWQEELYVPLLTMAAALLADAIVARRTARFCAAGALLGAAALTRSMPIYFVVATGLLWRRIDDDAARRGRHLCAWLAGFAVVVLPYTAAISGHEGRLTLVENIGFIHIDKFNPPGHHIASPDGKPRGVAGAATTYARQFAADPNWFARRLAYRVREQAKLTGSAWLQFFHVAGSARGAWIAKAIVTVWSDVPEAAMLLLAPLGAIVARRRGIAILLCAWCGVHIALVALAAFGGSRSRMPIEGILLTLAAIGCDVRGRDMRRRAAIPALAAMLVVMVALAQAAPSMVLARADYGLDEWVEQVNTRINHLRGPAGFNLPPARGTLAFRVRCARAAPRCGPIAVAIDDKPAGQISDAEARSGSWFRTAAFARARGVNYVELRPPAGASMDLEVDDPGVDPQVMAGVMTERYGRSDPDRSYAPISHAATASPLPSWGRRTPR